ncbi:hypothetical protein FM038_024815 [Shewanella eurypsychrophilus]|uniref:Uncharacterized protein n=1 Tax=Shewanella eurypsychrophilus TaxID=2593656 RepID=A0ABX6VCY2_9GAMM|nr:MULTISPECIES: hypothetical protein [Shewanella]QFU25025.1 hypothetical protein FS418_26440 [Shewanella sp. YLB-09]QPG60201.1 hypothetical protein FM038_024815 [Shewanella eurypsychrophilus]
MKTIITIFTFILFFANVQASENQLTAIGNGVKSKLMKTISTSTDKHKFPAIYVYDTQKQTFLSKQNAEAYLLTLGDKAIWSKLTSQWTKDTSQFSTTNETLAKALPMLKLDREFLILYDNLPTPMLEQFKAMDPELILKDSTLKSVLSSLDSSRSYTTY